ncbi:uncharacterized protein LOC119600447 [Lucilia sericata]|uniref:uncharacterized protein LOC119600447 n=1 Tax=Lucilia sericata TaxID=13632 RepID=UPI0018A81C6E|nr:uncharacterized protein LOC119600447 [Lucilia sericata]
MSKIDKKLINLNKNEFVDRRIEENEKFPELTIRLETIDSVLLLLDSQEEMVLINSLKHIMEYVRRNEENVILLKEKNLLNFLLQKGLYRQNKNILVKRLSLYLTSFIMENINCLLELDTSKIREIVQLCLIFYLEEADDFCCEYLSVILNKCLDDPQVVEMVLNDNEFVSKYFSTVANSTNPDVLLHSMELMKKILLVLDNEEKRNFITLNSFPLKRLLCELNCEYFDIRKSVLKVLQSLVTETGSNNVLNQEPWCSLLLEQLTIMFCESLLPEELHILVEVLAATLEQELMISLFFELNLFDKFYLRITDGSIELEIVCKALWVLAECAKCVKFIPRLVSSGLTEKLLECLLNEDNNAAAHILLGLNRLMKSPLASKRIIEAYDQDLLNKILKLLNDKEINIKTREQAANLLENLLSYAFHKSVSLILDLKFSNILSDVFAQAPEERSIDLLLSLLNIIEMITVNADYRQEICANSSLISNIGLLLMNSFSSAILVTNLFRCLCSIVDEEVIHQLLLETYLCSSIKRALQSLSNQLKTAATNFIMQTTRFPILLAAYIESGVLEVLILHQKHAYCVPTWTPAIESILSKSPTLKFCIRNTLGFTDITGGSDFMVSKKKFDDFRILQCILKEEVSPLHPVIVVNFSRITSPDNLVVKVPVNCHQNDELSRGSESKEWCYCRSPGDEFLPKYLAQVNNMLELENLAVNPLKSKKTIDFDNITKRVKIIAQVVAEALGNDLETLDLNTTEECSYQKVNCHLKELCMELHCSFIPLGRIRSGCQFERAILFKTLADQIGLPCTLQRSVDGRILFNELPLPVELEQDVHCDKNTLNFMPWRLLRPTHIVDLMHNVGELYPLHSRQALQYLRLC